METKSGVDWVDLEKERLYVRDKDLLSLIEGSDFVDTIFHMWIHKKPAENGKRMLNAVLVSFCGGWSITVPTILSARLAATTRAPIAQCLSAGFCSGGPAHTSAIERIMDIYNSVELNDIEGYVLRKIEEDGKIPGFGHPILRKDPRPPLLRRLYDELNIGGETIWKFDKIQETLNRKKGIFGNIDGINGAILKDLGFEDPSYGPAFFLMSRSLAMTAHIVEEYKNKPFSALQYIYPGFERMEYGFSKEIMGAEEDVRL
ncbi:MAG: citrate/2-methylcitrate synthase [Candidatus Micrarchaeota archaeon]